MPKDSQPLKILAVANVPPDPNSGAAGTVYHTNVAFRELGHVVDEVWNDELPQKIKHGNLHSLLEQPRNYRNAIMRRLDKNNKYDVVQISQPQGYLAAKTLRKMNFAGVVTNRSHGLELIMNDVLPYWHKKLGVPESKFPKSLLTSGLRYLLSRQWPAVLKYCDGVIVPCDMDRDYLIEKLKANPKQVQTIPHGVPDLFLKTPTNEIDESRSKKMLYVGQLSFFKAPLILIEILNRVLKKNADAQMTWICSASSHPWIIERLDSEVQSRVSLKDWSPQAELLAQYDSHGIQIFPSLTEGAGKASLEGMSRGLCLVASKTGGMKDRIENGKNGYVCEVGNVDEFTQTINKLLTDHKAVQSAGEQARISTEKFSWNRCAQKAIEFYRTLLEKKANSQ